MSVKGFKIENQVVKYDYQSLENIPEIDNTLTQEGLAADAKTTGDEITNLKNTLVAIIRILDTGIHSFNGGIQTINASQDVNINYVYYNSNSTSPSFHYLMVYDNDTWVYALDLQYDIARYLSNQVIAQNQEMLALDTNILNVFRVINRTWNRPLTAFNGGLQAINQSSDVNINTIYYNSNTNSPTYNYIMVYNGIEWVFLRDLRKTDCLFDNDKLKLDTIFTMLNNFLFQFSVDWESGNINGGTGEKETSNNTIRTVSLIPLELGSIILTKLTTSGYTFACRGYSGNSITSQNFVYSHTFISDAKDYYINGDDIPNNCKYLAFCLRKTNITISDASVLSLKRISSFSTIYQYIQSFINDNESSNKTTWSSEKISSLTNELTMEINTIADLVDSPLTISDELANKIKTVLGYNRINKFLNLCFITDTHSNIQNAKYAINALQALQSIKVCDGYIHGGDIITTYNYGFTEYVKQMTRNIGYYKKYGNLYIVKGNHDNNHADLESSNATKPQFKQLAQIGMERAVFNSSDNGTCYYYVDYELEKIRCIMLDSYSIEHDSVTVNVDTVQNSWLYNTALNVQNGWTVIVFAHQFNDALTDTINILKAFNNRGTSYGSYIFNNNISTKFVGVIHGHDHSDTTNTTFGFRVVGVTCAYGDSDTSGALDVFTIDTVNNILYETRIGDGNDRNFNFN